MTAPPLGLRAHDRRPIPARHGLELAQTVRELRRFHVIGVALELRDAPSSVRRRLRPSPAPAECGEVPIADGFAREEPFELGGVRPRNPARARIATHVGEQLDPLRPEELEEILASMRGVSDGEDLDPVESGIRARSTPRFNERERGSGRRMFKRFAQFALLKRAWDWWRSRRARRGAA